MSEDEGKGGRFSVTRRDVNRLLLEGCFGFLSHAARGRIALHPISRVLFDFAVAGSAYYGSRRVLHGLAPGERLRLWHDAGNPHDADAVAVLHADGTMLGYVPRRANAPVAGLLRRGLAAHAEVVAMLDVTSEDAIPDDLVFTAFCDGDPRLRLIALG